MQVVALAATSLAQVYKLMLIGAATSPSSPLRRTDDNEESCTNLSVDDWKLVRFVYSGRSFSTELELETTVGAVMRGTERAHAIPHNHPALVCLIERRAMASQQLMAFPASCSTDGGCRVDLVGEYFPYSDKLCCRFGTSIVPAEADSSGEPNCLHCRAPPHPAGPVTLSVSFDGGATFLRGPTFTYLDPEAEAAQALGVPVSCGAGASIGVGTILGNSLSWAARWDRPPDPDGGGGGTAT